jgi:hypothetical protein
MTGQPTCWFCGCALPERQGGLITRVYVADEAVMVWVEEGGIPRRRQLNRGEGRERSVCSACLDSRPRLRKRVTRKVRLA